MIYLDHNSTTRPDPAVRQAMVEAQEFCWGNPSAQHSLGQEARAALDEARGQVARLAGVTAMDVIFTSGGTEAVNQVLLGGRALAEPKHLIVSAIEHPCVLDAATLLERAGWEVTRLPVDGRGIVDPADLRRALKPETALISVMLANNDTGVMQPVRELATIAREAAIPLHTDIVQAAGRVAVNAVDLGADFLTLSGHKFHGPKGTGAIICGTRRRPAALLHGGPQEAGLRAGTENVTALTGLGVAAELVWQSLDSATDYMRELRDRLEEGLTAELADVVIHGAGVERLPNTLYMAFEGVRAQRLAARLDLDGIAVSTSSACSTGSDAPPHVLLAMGVSPALALGSIRFSVGRDNTRDEIEETIGRVAELVTEMRRR